jgi:rhamnulokinase
MPSTATTYAAAIDLGATSGRVILGSWTDQRLQLSEVHRFKNSFRPLGGHEYWDIGSLWHEMRSGLAKVRHKLPREGHLGSVGVDTWGVDYVLLNDSGRVVYPVHSYRDARTQAGLHKLAGTRAALDRIYKATGIPNVFYNTSLQLAEVVAACPAVTDIATRCLFLPDYFNYLLSGRMENELTIASTSQLIDVMSCGWSRAALDHFHIPPHWFSKPMLPRVKLGRLRGEEKGEFGNSHFEKTQVVSVPGHDTACAFDAMPAAEDGSDLYLSSGTWSLVGFESDTPILGAEALAAGIANERTATGGYRPLRNVIGLWLLDNVVNEFDVRPVRDSEWAALMIASQKLPAPEELLNTADAAFGNPTSMKDAVDAQLKRRGIALPKHLAGYTRLICDSLGQAHADAMRTFEKLTSHKFKRILIVGGGSRNALLCQATADAAGIPVVSFALEGTAVGNLASQFIALGAVKDLATFRAHLASTLPNRVYTPKS